MRNVILDLEVIHEILKKRAPVAILGGIAVLAAGYLLGRIEMLLVGGIVTVVGSVEYVIRLLRIAKRLSGLGDQVQTCDIVISYDPASVEVM